MFLDEPGAKRVDDLVATVGVRHCISVLTTIEIRSAIRRLEGLNDISHSAAARAMQRLEAELAHFLISQVTDAVLAKTRQVVDSTQLRALDALQLATALLEFDSMDASPVLFIASDHKLLAAAQRAGLAILDPSEGS